MKAEYSLTKDEYNNIQQMLENIPIDLCGYVECPICSCDNCPLRTISEQWYMGLTALCTTVNERLATIKPNEENNNNDNN